MTAWFSGDDQTGRRATEEQRRRQAVAAMNSMSVGPIGLPLALTSDPRQFHAEMLKRVAAVEETIAKLPTSPAEQIEPRLVEEIKSAAVRLKTILPDESLPTDAIKEESRIWRKFAESLATALATDLTKRAISEAAKALWARYGDQLVEKLKALAELLGS
jgi:hypothetical protein